MKHPDIDRAVHTTPPIISAATIPLTPFSPTATITTDASMSVMSVIPDTGLLPTMAMALAATVVKRKAITATSSIPTTANLMLPSMMPNQKKMKVTRRVTAEPIAMILNDRSRCVRSCLLSSVLLPFISLAASVTAPFIMSHDFIMPMSPAMAMPPMPMLLPYSRNIVSGLMLPTVSVIAGFQALRTWSWNITDIRGMMSHHTANEPRHIMSEYFRPTM